MSKVDEIRRSEKESHETLYKNNKLFEEGSFLHRPVKTVMDILPLLAAEKAVRVLDLGCGVGRNSIPIAQYFADKPCVVDCVDLLDIAIEKLAEYSSQYGVSNSIVKHKSTIENFVITADTYNLIIAVSALEHVAAEKDFVYALDKIKHGIKHNGIICLTINTNVVETDLTSGKLLAAQFEVNLKTVEMDDLLLKAFNSFNILKHSVVPQQYEIKRNGRDVLISTQVVTLVVQKPYGFQ
jgi:2-polyprenyl-3-methyl-5-hydroxy-6-metoxy-1,4-benzoquinol methylase